MIKLYLFTIATPEIINSKSYGLQVLGPKTIALLNKPDHCTTTLDIETGEMGVVDIISMTMIKKSRESFPIILLDNDEYKIVIDKWFIENYASVTIVYKYPASTHPPDTFYLVRGQFAKVKPKDETKLLSKEDVININKETEEFVNNIPELGELMVKYAKGNNDLFIYSIEDMRISKGKIICIHYVDSNKFKELGFTINEDTQDVDKYVKELLLDIDSSIAVIRYDQYKNIFRSMPKLNFIDKTPHNISNGSTPPSPPPSKKAMIKDINSSRLPSKAEARGC